MRRKKKEVTTSNDLVSVLQSKYGQLAATTYDKVFAVNSIPTGILALDRALGGGVPLGRMIELLGDPSSGKTTMALTIAANSQLKFPDKNVLYVDVEHALDLQWASKIGVNVTDNFIHSNPITGEEACDIVEIGLESGQVSVIIIDSVAALMPEVEKKTEIGEANIGAQARLVAQAIRRLNSSMPLHKECIIIFINQQRARIGGGPSSFAYGPTKKATGGLALPFYMTTRMKVAKIETTLDADKNVTGQKVKVDVLKHKVLSGPGHKVNFRISNKFGIDTTHELLEWGIETNRIKQSGSWFEIIGVTEKFQGEEKVKKYIDEHLFDNWKNEFTKKEA